MSDAQTINDYATLRRALDARRHELGWTFEDLDHRSGLQSGYSAKLLCRAAAGISDQCTSPSRWRRWAWSLPFAS